MKAVPLVAATVLAAVATPGRSRDRRETEYRLGPDSQRHEGVPRGEVTKHEWNGDLDNRFGSWWLAKQQMAAALAFRGYDFEFARGPGGHDGTHGGAIFPDTLRWLWSDVVGRGGS